MPEAKNVRVSLQITSRKARDGWYVDIFGDGTDDLHNIPLQDPLDSAERSLCRWYVEKYVQLSPFWLDEADEAELLLAYYGNNLLRQLPLRSLLQPQLQGASYDLNNYLIHIYIYDNDAEVHGHSQDSIHRLFWETLEDSELWDHPRWKVVVQRSMLRLPIDLPYVARLPWPSAMPTQQSVCLNILLVIGRDTSRNPSSYEDSDPFLATDVLFKVQRHHQSLQSRSKLNIEIARPGTLTALEQHLDRAEAVHGPGYFHIVHFDMHGKAGKVGQYADSADKSGYLCFSDPDSHTTVPIPATSVQAILKRHSVRFAVLNFCESASASFGDNANIASGFIKNGVLGVLDMSFKVSSATAAIFLENFYRSFLVDGQSFSASAAAGRAALRRDTSRPAIYGLQRDVDDSFVVVAYGPTLELLLAHPASHTNWHPLQPSSEASCGSKPDKQPFVGREFDLLRIEKELVQKQCLYLYGIAGVGKSSFMAYAASLWKFSSFVDAVVHIDLDQNSILSSEDLSTTLVRQLLSQVSFPKNREHLWSVYASYIRYYSKDFIASILAEILSFINAVIIVDGLHSPLSNQDQYFVPGVLNGSNRQELLHTINYLFHLARDLNRSKKLYLILAGRRSDPPWLAQMSAGQAELLCYELGGLSLPNAIEVSHRALQPLGVNTEEWTSMDAACLDAVIDLLQGNPSALLAILPLQKNANVSWQNFYRYLQSGPVKSVEDLQRMDLAASPVAQEIHRFLEVRHPGQTFFLSLASSYWHQTAFINEVVHMAQSLAEDFVEDEPRPIDDNVRGWIEAALGIGIDQGLFDLDKTQTCLLLHPLFTIIGQAMRSQFVPSADMPRLRTLHCKSVLSIPPMNPESQFSAAVGVANLLTCVQHCYTDVPLDAWCLEHFVIYASQGIGRWPMAAEVLLCTRLLLLFWKFTCMPRLVDEDWLKVLQAFTAILLLFSVAGDVFDISAAAEVRQHTNIGLDFVSTLVGNQEDEIKTIFFWNACWQLSRCLSTLALGEKGAAKEIWEDLRSSDICLQDMVGLETLTRMKKAYLDYASGNVTNYDDLVQAKKALFSAASSFEGLSILRMTFAFLYLCVEQNESVFDGESTTSSTPAQESEI
ncbi:hypothetical protein S40293_01320 [Stachybotrys chartarum IBT 40293]|nr:hypothetical protein S40293_01320 [Stachybotrys chartarum IBT 40293]